MSGRAESEASLPPPWASNAHAPRRGPRRERDREGGSGPGGARNAGPCGENDVSAGGGSNGGDGADDVHSTSLHSTPQPGHDDGDGGPSSTFRPDTARPPPPDSRRRNRGIEPREDATASLRRARSARLGYDLDLHHGLARDPLLVTLKCDPLKPQETVLG